MKKGREELPLSYKSLIRVLILAVPLNDFFSEPNSRRFEASLQTESAFEA
jgi:hypothetical protein